MNPTAVFFEKQTIPVVQSGVLLYKNIPTLKPDSILSSTSFLQALSNLPVNWQHHLQTTIAYLDQPFFDASSQTVFATLRWIAPYIQNPPVANSFFPSLGFSASTFSHYGVFSHRQFVAAFSSIVPLHLALCATSRHPALRLRSFFSYKNQLPNFF